MPIEIEVPEQGIVEFPDGMDHDAIRSVLQKKFPPKFQDLSKTEPLTLRPPRVQGPSTTAGGPRAPLASYAETVAEPTEELMQPRIQAPEAKITEQDSPVSVVGKEAWNLAKGLPEFMSSTAGLMGVVGGAGAPTATTALFAGQMFNDLGQQVVSTYKNWDQMSRNQKIKAVVDMVGTGAMGGLLAKHATTGVLDATVPARALAKEIGRSEVALPPVEPEAAKGPVGAEIQAGERAPAPPMVTPRDLTPQSEAAAVAAPPGMVGEPTTKLSPQAEAAIQEIVPAIKTMSGEVVSGEKGQSHNDIIEQNKIPAKEVDRREFVNAATGQEVSREKLAEAIPTKKEGEAHSSDLAKAQEAVTPTTVDAIAQVKSTYGQETVQRAFQEYLKAFNLENASERVKGVQLALFAKNILAKDPKALSALEVATKPPPPTPAPVKAEPGGGLPVFETRGPGEFASKFERAKVTPLIDQYEAKFSRAIVDFTKNNPRGPEEGLIDYRNRIRASVPLTPEDRPLLQQIVDGLKTNITAIKADLATEASPRTRKLLQTDLNGVKELLEKYQKELERAPSPPPPQPQVKAEPSGADVYQSIRGDLHQVWVRIPGKPAIEVGSIEQHPELSDKAKAIEQANKVWASREQKPIPPRSLPAYGINSKDVARQYGMPEDFYGTADERGMVSSKYRTKEYDAAIEAEKRASKIQGINAPTIRRQARERTEAEFRKIVESARKAEPSAPPPPSGISPTDKGITKEEKAFRATPTGQRAMASRAARIGTLHTMNEAIRKIDPNEAFDRRLIDTLPDSQIDAWQEDLRQSWNKLLAERGKPTPTSAPSQTEAAPPSPAQPKGETQPLYETTKTKPDVVPSVSSGSRGETFTTDAKRLTVELRIKGFNPTKDEYPEARQMFADKGLAGKMYLAKPDDVREPNKAPWEYLVVEDVTVAKSQQRKGFGIAIYNQALKMAKDLGYEGICSHTDDRNAASDALWAKFSQGKRQGFDLLKRPIPEKPTPPPVEQKGVEPDKGPGIGQGPGAKTYAPSAKPEPPETREGTGLKNAVAELEAAGIGHDLPETELRAMVPRWEQAGDVLRADPEAGRRLADDLISNPERGMTDEDSALLLRHKVELINAVNDAASRTHIGDAESRAIADREYMAKSDELKALLDAVKKRGSQWGREGRWRQAMAYEDYTFATQEGLLRSSKGGLPLTEEERSRLMADVEAHRKNAAEQEAHRIKAEEQGRELAAKLELERIEKENLKKQIPKFDKRILAAAEKIVQNIKTSADAARARIAARRAQPGAQAGSIDPADIDDYAIIASSHIAEFGLDAAKVIDRLAIEFGENIRSAADQIISKANELLDNIKAPDPVKRVIKKKATTAEEQTELTNKIREKLQGKRLDQITPLVQKLARTFSDMGVRGWRPLGDAVHGVLKEMIPNLDYRETLDAISGHGKFRIPNQEEGARALRDAKAQMNEIRKIQEVIAREPVKPTGLRRDLPSDVKRRLTQIYENVKRKFGVVSDDPATQLRSALQARKTYYEHRISDLQDEITARKRTVKTKAPPPTDPELERLITEYKAVKAAHDEVFGKRGLTNEQRAELESKSLDRQIAEVERQLKEGDIFPAGKKEAFRATANEAKRANLEALKAERENLRESIQPTQRLTPEEKRLNAIKAGMSRRQADLLDRMARGDFAPKKKAPPVPLDPEGARLMAKGREIELRFEKARRQAELAQRSPAKKFVDRFVVGTYNLGRAVAVMWHGTVGMFTHAGGLFWRATTAAIWWRNFIRQFPMWLKPAYHEQLIHRLKTDPDFHTWLKAGAKIDPDRIYTDYELYGKWMGAAGGARGFDALKLTRMELNKMEWEKVSDEIKADPEKADAARKAIAEINNRATGTESLYGKVGPVDISGVAHAIMFAPKLYASRWSRVVLDPIKTVETFANWEKATPAERLAAKMKLKHAAEFIGIYLGALAVNQGLLMATGSKQKVNFKDPDKSDWLKFKGFGKNVVADGGLLDPVRLLGQVVWGDLVKPRTKQERFLKGTRFEAAGKHLVNYVRSKFNPSLGLVVDSATQQDYAGRALPFSSEPSKYKSQKPYKWGEWLLSHGPIPISMGTRVAFDELQKRGLSKVDAAALLEGAAAAAVGMTGVHETEDYSLKK